MNILLIVTCFCLLIFNCSIKSRPDFNKIESYKNNNYRNSKYQNYGFFREIQPPGYDSRKFIDFRVSLPGNQSTSG